MQVAIKCGWETTLPCIPARPPTLHTVSINVHSLLIHEVNVLLFYTCICCTVVVCYCYWASIMDCLESCWHTVQLNLPEFTTYIHRRSCFAWLH